MSDPKVVFTPDQVVELEWWQNSGQIHPFTCRAVAAGAEIPHPHRELVPTVRGWICPFCDYTQEWAHEFMLSGQVRSRIGSRLK